MAELLPKRESTIQNGDNETVARALRLLASMVETGPRGAGLLLEYTELRGGSNAAWMNLSLRIGVEADKLPDAMTLLRTVR